VSEAVAQRILSLDRSTHQNLRDERVIMPDAVLQNFIDGEFVASSATATLDLVNPVDESVVGRAPISNQADVEAAVEAAERAFQT
jgi:hypothetical protein